MRQYILHGLFALIFSLNFGGDIASASPPDDRITQHAPEGEWSLKTLKDGAVLSLEYNQWITLSNDAIETASFGFSCDRRTPSGKIGATLFPFEGSYNNQQDEVPVLIERSSNESPDTSLLQKWGNGYKYIFLNPTAEVKKLVEYLKSRQKEGSPFVDVLFSGDYNGRTEKLLKVAVALSNFSEAFSRFESACTAPLN
jgi:hypothetical protein